MRDPVHVGGREGDLMQWQNRRPPMTFQRIENPLQGPSRFEAQRVLERVRQHCIYVLNF